MLNVFLWLLTQIATFQFLNGVSNCAMYPGATTDVKVTACLLDAIQRINGNTTGTADSTGLSGLQQTYAQINVGDKAGDSVLLLLPCFATWQGLMTDGLQSVVNQMGGTTVKSVCPSSGPAGKMIFTSGPNANLAYVYQTTGTDNAPYLYAQGFNIMNIPGGHATSTGIGFYFNGPLFDGTLISNVNVYDSLDLHPVKVYNVGASATWESSAINADYYGMPFWANTDSGGYVQSLNMVNDTIVHPGAGLPAVYCSDTRFIGGGTKISDIRFSNLYTETGADGKTANYQSNGCGKLSFAHTLIKSYATAGNNTAPGILVTPAYNTFITVDDMTFRVGSTTYTLPATGVVNLFTNKVQLTDSMGNLARYP